MLKAVSQFFCLFWAKRHFSAVVQLWNGGQWTQPVFMDYVPVLTCSPQVMPSSPYESEVRNEWRQTWCLSWNRQGEHGPPEDRTRDPSVCRPNALPNELSWRITISQCIVEMWSVTQVVLYYMCIYNNMSYNSNCYWSS
jgi:hypothetical protein